MKTFANLEAGDKIYATTIFSDFSTNGIDYHEIREIYKGIFIRAELDNDMIVTFHSTKRSSKQHYEATNSYLVFGLTEEDVKNELKNFKKEEVRRLESNIGEMARIIQEAQQKMQTYQKQLKNITANLNF